MTELILAIDQGTTGCTAALFTPDTLTMVAAHSVDFPQIYPQPGWVEHNPEQIWNAILQSIAAVLSAVKKRGFDPTGVVAIGITNQRETVVPWSRKDGRPAGNAIVWQDRRTADFCDTLKRSRSMRDGIRKKTGLVCDPYFSGSKMRWLLAHHAPTRALAKKGQLAFGTMDSYCIHRLTGGEIFATDHTNACRTMLYNLKSGGYDPDLCKLFGIDPATLPEIRQSVGEFGRTRGVPGLPDGIPILGCLGDQQAALYGQGCLSAGEGKITYGTGAFFLMNVGKSPVLSADGLLTSVALSSAAGRSFAIEGSAFIAGAAIQFLRDNFGWFTDAGESEALARSAERDPNLLFIPALSGLAAPFWNPRARGTLFGLTRGVTKGQIVRAVLESIALQNVQLLRLMQRVFKQPVTRLGVDGGASQNDLLMQFQADVAQVRLVRPSNPEITATGAARAARVALTGSEPPSNSEGVREFKPSMPLTESTEIFERWLRAATMVDKFYS